MKKYDAIVVGAGPGGSAAAYLLAAAGLRVALVEKAKIPRSKLCGGLLSPRSEKVYKSIFGGGWEDGYELTSSDVGFYYRDQRINELQNSRTMFFTMRSKFDTLLAHRAQSKGARLMDGAGAAELEPEFNRIRFQDGSEIRADFIVGADGVNSRVAKSLGLRLHQGNLAAGIEIEVPRRGHLANLNRPEIYFGVVRWGYGWVFPKVNTLTVGIAGLVQKNRNLRDNFQAFLKQVCSRVPDIPWSGHPVPFGNFMRRPGKANVMLVGDAAGLVEPVTGEGIAFAMESGRQAAGAVLEAARAGKPESALRFYQPLYEQVARTLRQAKRMRHLIFPQASEKLLVKVLSRSDSLARQFMNLLADEIGYEDYSRFLALKVYKGVGPG